MLSKTIFLLVLSVCICAPSSFERTKVLGRRLSFKDAESHKEGKYVAVVFIFKSIVVWYSLVNCIALFQQVYNQFYRRISIRIYSFPFALPLLWKLNGNWRAMPGVLLWYHKSDDAVNVIVNYDVIICKNNISRNSCSGFFPFQYTYYIY